VCVCVCVCVCVKVAMGTSVLLHCSDGWDRTPQAQIFSSLVTSLIQFTLVVYFSLVQLMHCAVQI
jgi:hypothetical protein